MPEFSVVRYQETQAYSRYLRSVAEFEQFQDFARDQMIERLSHDIMAEKVAEETREFVEGPVWDTPRQAFLDSLPLSSFRRRFLSFLWGYDPWKQHAKRRTHTVTMKRWIAHPTQGVLKQDIEESLGYWA